MDEVSQHSWLEMTDHHLSIIATSKQAIAFQAPCEVVDSRVEGLLDDEEGLVNAILPNRDR